MVPLYLLFNSFCSISLRATHDEDGTIIIAWQRLAGMKRGADRASHGADGAFVEERYASTDHVYAFPFPQSDIPASIVD